jgi:hypothetical protein
MLTTPEATTAPVTRTLGPAAWRIAGGLALAHVVLLFTGFSQEVSVEHGQSAGSIRDTLLHADFNRAIAGGYVESLSMVLLLPALAFVARVVGRRTEIGRWAASTGLAAGIAFVAVTLATGMPAGAAALYAAHHGVDAQTIAVVDDIRNYAFFLGVLLCAAHAASVGVAALADRRFTRWLGYGGLFVGVVSTIGVAAHFVNVASMLWVVWWVGVGITLIRAAGRSTSIS